MASGSDGPSRDLPDQGSPDASSLLRSAVMLTGAAEAADQLVLATLHHLDRRSPGAGGEAADAAGPVPDPALAALVREYLRRSSRRRVDRVEPVGVAVDAGEVLSSLRPRQRAAAVLTLVQGWPPGHTARVLGVPPERVSSLVPATVGLADAFRALAYHHYGPPPDLFAAVPAEGCGGQGGIDRGSPLPATDGPAPGPATGSGRTQGPGRRPRAVRRGAAVIVAVAVVTVASVYGQGGGSQRAVVDGGAMGQVSSSSGLAGRGWVLSRLGDPPAFLEGLRLIDVSVIDYADPTRPLTLDTLPRRGRAMYAALWCDMPPRDVNLVLPTVALTLSGHTVALSCAGRHDDPPVHRLFPLPPPDEPGRVPVTLEWGGDLPDRGSAVLATYTEFGQNEPPRNPLVGPGPPPRVPEDAAVLDNDHVPVQVDGGELFARRVTVSSRTGLSIWSQGTGRFRIVVDGIVASDDGDLRQGQAAGRHPPRPVWQDQDPQLRDGSWTVHAPGQTRQFPLPEVLRPGPGAEREVTVQVHVDTGTQGRWQVQVSHASPVAA